MKDRRHKNLRTLDMYVRFCEGKIINKTEEALRFGVEERSIQRDIDDIRAFLDERAFNTGENRTIEYDREKKGFVMKGDSSALMTNSEIFAVSKVLLESRAFTKKEISSILDKMIAGCVPEKNMKMVSDLLANEKYHYVELRHRKQLRNLIWDLGQDIRNLQQIEITYEKQNKDAGEKKYVLEPVVLFFSDFYFYLNAYIVERNDRGIWQHKYDYPAVFRLDRISDYKRNDERFHLAYRNRFEEGEFRRKVQFMYAGKLMRFRFRYSGPNVDAVLDRLPTANVIQRLENGMVVEAEVYGTGILMWLLSQGKYVEVLEPESLRNQMKKLLCEMLDNYK